MPGLFTLGKGHGPCGFFVFVKCGSSKHCSSSIVGSAGSVRSCTAVKVPCFEAVPGKLKVGPDDP